MNRDKDPLQTERVFSLYNKEMKLLMAVVCCLAVVTSAGVASAHVLKQSNGISAVLHVTPDDKPVTGQPTKLELAFGDTRDAFSLPDCDCRVSIAHDETVVFAHPKLQTTGTLSGVATFTFTKPALYDVLIDGHSRDGAFPDFHLDYDVEVAQGKTTSIEKRRTLEAEAVVVVAAAAALWLARRTSW